MEHTFKLEHPFRMLQFVHNYESVFFNRMIHIGNIIEQVFHEQGRSASWLAKQLHCDRTNVYNIFKRESIDTALLVRISNILQHNFLRYYDSALKEV